MALSKLRFRPSRFGVSHEIIQEEFVKVAGLGIVGAIQLSYDRDLAGVAGELLDGYITMGIPDPNLHGELLN